MDTRPECNEGLELLESQDQEIGCIERVIDDHFANRHIDVLDAGCGRKWQIKLQMPFTITGVDADQAALDKREDLDVALKEDIQAADFGRNQFDLIYCSYVLEHVDGAEDLLSRFKAWLKPNGLLILRFPDKYTVFGFITRKTPHWVHVAYKRHLLKMQMAGLDGHGPYPTVYDEVVSLTGMRQFCLNENLQVVGEWGIDKSLPRRGRFIGLRKAMIRATHVLSQGKLDSSYSNLTFIIHKPCNETAV